MTDPLSPDTGGRTDAGHPTDPHAPTDTDGARGDGEAPGVPLPPLPDLCEVDLETLRTLDHPVLAEMVTELRERAERPREMLWGFSNSPF